MPERKETLYQEYRVEEYYIREEPFYLPLADEVELFEAAYHQQTVGAIAGLYEFAPDAEGEDNGAVEAAAENGQLDLELAEA